MAAPKFNQGIVNPEAAPARPRIVQPAPVIPAAPIKPPAQTGTGMMWTGGNVGGGTTPSTLFPVPTGKPATSVSAPGGMISQAPAGTRPVPTSQTRGTQRPQPATATPPPGQMQTPAPVVAPATPPVAAPAPATTTTAAPSGQQQRRRPAYTPPAGYDRLAGYAADASPDQILFEKAQIYARNLARGIEMSDAEVEKRFQERLKRFQETGEPSKNKDPEDAVVAAPEQPVAETPAEEVKNPLQDELDAMRQEMEQLRSQLQDAIAKQSQTPQQTPDGMQAGTSQLQTLAQALAPKPSGGSLANLDRTRIGQMLQVAAPIMFSGTFAEVVAAIIAAGITPTAPELAWLEAEVAKYRAG